MAQDPKQRPADAGDFLQRLRAVLPSNVHDTANSSETTDETVVSTRFSYDKTPGKTEEARPLQREIGKLLEQSGEIPPDEMPRLWAMAQVDGLDEAGLQALIHGAAAKRSNGPRAVKNSKIPHSPKSKAQAAMEIPAVSGASFKWLAAVVVILAVAVGIYLALPTPIPEAGEPVPIATVPQSQSEPIIPEPVTQAATPADFTGGEESAGAMESTERNPESVVPVPDVEGQSRVAKTSRETVVEEPPSRTPVEPAAAAAPGVAVKPGSKAESSAPASLAGQVGKIFRDALSDGGEGPRMVVLPTDLFNMGCVAGRDCVKNERPAHPVSISKPIAMMTHEVKFAEYDRFARATGRKLPDDNGWGRGARPVINVSWKDANGYADWVSAQTGERYRLPSEAEWEFAARAGSNRRYTWGVKPLAVTRPTSAATVAAAAFPAAATAGSTPRRWEALRQTLGVCLTCTATSRSGYRTVITRATWGPRPTVAPGRQTVPRTTGRCYGCCGEALGSRRPPSPAALCVSALLGTS
ncbi:MAG: SUMF1/EgtB/PvdO family nonheme iron enzyme [Halioglobus sp.]|nr:SUMF1/EgtB/PvdO family nonheme iron enzyme [Halioglobus sp.]